MERQYTARIISHTHWDREWYLNSPYTNEWLIPFFDGLFAMLRKEPDYRFVLDGQLSMIDDYFEELAKNGRSVTEARRTITRFVKSGALSIGPYYLQPDWQLISEESLVRNLMIGKMESARLGGSMHSGWLLDNFGQISQTAQIHVKSGLTGLFVWRGVAMDPNNVESEFLWESPDGTSILSVYLLNSYRNVMRLAEYQSIMESRMRNEVEKLKPFATTSNLLMMNGYDQEMVPDDIQPFIRTGQLDGKDFTTVQTDPDSYLEAVRSENPVLQKLSGPLYNGRFISVFPGVMSSRMYLKIQNDTMQRLLEHSVEPLMSFAWLTGYDYQRTQLLSVWKTLLKNHPHDSICGVSIDDVHKDMEERNRQVYAGGMAMLENSLESLAAAIDTSKCSGKEALIVFNSSSRRRSGVISVQGDHLFVQDVPAMGYAHIIGSSSEHGQVSFSARSAENSRISLTIHDDGSFSVTDTQTGIEHGPLGILEDTGDSGDEYNYSYPDTDRRITSEHISADISIEGASDVHVTYRIAFDMSIPESDVEEHSRRSDTHRLLPVRSFLTLEADSPVVKIQTYVRNTAKDHRMRVLFPTGYRPEASFAGSPFDITERPIEVPAYDESQIPEHVRSVIVGAREAEGSTFFHNSGFIDMNDGQRGLAVFDRGLPEYQIIEGDTIALTLFRSVGWIAKDINTRIGDAGPEIFTPDAQCLREMSFEYAVCPHSGDAYSGIIREADDYLHEMTVVSTSPGPGFMPSEYSFLSAEDTRDSVRLTAFKRSEAGDAIIVRGVNTCDHATELTLATSLTVFSASSRLLTEEFFEPIEIDDGKIHLDLGPKEIFTIALECDKLGTSEHQRQTAYLEDQKRVLDFSDYPYADYVTDEDIEQESRRAESLLPGIEKPMHRRTALEAQLSAILTRERKDEQTIRELGYQLNEARVQRRIHDYIRSDSE